MPSRHRLQLGEEMHTVVVDDQDDRLRITVDDDEPVEVDATASGLPGRLSLLIGGVSHSAYVSIEGDIVHVTTGGRAFVLAPARAGGRARGAIGGFADQEGQITSPLAGVVIDVRVGVGDEMEAGSAVCVVEAMKMQNEVPIPRSGTITAVHCASGQRVERGELLVEYESSE